MAEIDIGTKPQSWLGWAVGLALLLATIIALIAVFASNTDQMALVVDDDPDAAFEIACRLIDYIAVVEPIRTS